MKLQKEVKVGIFALSAILLLFFGLNYMKNTSVFDSHIKLSVAYAEINGLKTGSKVMYKGYTVGQVQSIVFDEGTGKLLVEFEYKSSIQLPSDSYAVIKSLDLFGAMGIVLRPGKSTAFIKSGDSIADSLAPGMMSGITGLADELQDLKESVSASLKKFDNTLAALQTESTDTVNQLNKLVRNLNATSSQATVSLQRMTKTMNKINNLTDSINVFLAYIRTDPAINGSMSNIKTMTDSLVGASGEIKTIFTNANKAVADLQGLITKVAEDESAANALLGDPMMNKMEKTVSDLDALFIDMKEHPGRYIHFSVFGKKEKEPKN